MGYPRAVYYAAALALTAIPAAAPAADYSGNDIVKDCPENGSWIGGACFGRVIGALTGFKLKADLDKTQVPFCVRSGVTNGQIVDVVVEWLKRHPEKRDMSFDVVSVLAVRDAFPCS